jgi:hypothetical protein
LGAEGVNDYQWLYKYTGKAANFTVKVPDYKLAKSGTLKSNGFLEVNFDLVSQAQGISVVDEEVWLTKRYFHLERQPESLLLYCLPFS